MAQPSPEKAIRTLDDGRQQLVDLAARLTDEQLERPATIGGGDWSAKDLVAHLEVWEASAPQARQEWRTGTLPAIEDVFAKGAEGVDALNAERVQAKRSLTISEASTQATDTHRELIEELSHIDPEEWEAKAFYETERRTRLGTLLGAITGAPKRPFGHAFAHLPDLEAYVDEATG
jgi:hypothetical protein